MKRFAIRVDEVNGYCACGYQVGDMIYCNGLETPQTPFCGGAYMALFPMQTSLFNGCRFNFEDNPQSKTKLACPDNGYVVFTITLLEEDEVAAPAP